MEITTEFFVQMIAFITDGKNVISSSAFELGYGFMMLRIGKNMKLYKAKYEFHSQ